MPNQCPDWSNSIFPGPFLCELETEERINWLGTPALNLAQTVGLMLPWIDLTNLRHCKIGGIAGNQCQVMLDGGCRNDRVLNMENTSFPAGRCAQLCSGFCSVCCYWQDALVIRLTDGAYPFSKLVTFFGVFDQFCAMPEFVKSQDRNISRYSTRQKFQDICVWRRSCDFRQYICIE